MNKLRQNYKIVDIGIDIARIERSKFYAAEKVTAKIWEYRNPIKYVMHALIH